MTEGAREVLRKELKLPRSFQIKEKNDLNKYYIVATDREHFIDWVDKRTSINHILDYTLRIIEGGFTTYTKDKEVIEYYIDKVSNFM